MTQEEALFKYLLHLGDNALIRSCRLSEWCSNAPILEEDLALTNFSLDMIGRAQALLEYAGQIEGKGRSADTLAYTRNERKFLNVLIVELPNTNFAYTMARELFVSAFEYYYYTELLQSANSGLAAIATKSIKEIKYHLEHSSDWVVRLGDGTPESHDKIQEAVDELWSYTGELFEMGTAAKILAEQGAISGMHDISVKWKKHIAKVLQEATLDMPQDAYMHSGGLIGLHTEYMGHILSEMQYLQHAYPDATW